MKGGYTVCILFRLALGQMCVLCGVCRARSTHHLTTTQWRGQSSEVMGSVRQSGSGSWTWMTVTLSLE